MNSITNVISYGKNQQQFFFTEEGRAAVPKNIEKEAVTENRRKHKKERLALSIDPKRPNNDKSGVPKGIPFGHAQGKFTPVVPPVRRDVLEEGWKEKKACSFQSKPLMDEMASPRGFEPLSQA